MAECYTAPIIFMRLRRLSWLLEREPCLVLLRHPHDAILSYFIRFPHISVGQCMKDYVRFYETIHPHQVSYLLARFESVTRDFGALMKA